MATGIVHLLPNGQQYFTDQNGEPLAGGFVYHYVPGTTTPSTTWVDQGLTTPNTNPVVLDAAGRATIWGNTTYRQLVTDRFGTTIWDLLVGDGDLDNLTLNNPTIVGGTVTGATISGGTLTTSVGPSIVTADGPNPNPLPSNPVQGNRTLAAFVGSFVDARNFLGTGGAALRATSDDSSIIQTAVNYAQSIGGATVYLGPGPLNIPSGVTVSWPSSATGVNLKGDGPYSTIININGNLNNDVFALTFGNPAHCQILDLGVACNGIGAGGAVVHFINNYAAHVENVRIWGGFYNGIAVQGGANQYLCTIKDGIFPAATSANACIVLGDDVHGVTQGVYIDNCKLAGSQFGVYMRHASGVVISNTECLAHGFSGFITEPAVSETVKSLTMTNCEADTCANAAINLGSTGGVVQSVSIVGGSANNSQNGIIIATNPNAENISIVGVQCVVNLQSAIFNFGANGVIFSSNVCLGNGVQASNTYDAIAFQNCINCVISNNFVGAGSSFPAHHRYAIALAGSADYCVVTSNTTGGPGGTGSINNTSSGTHNVVANNTGT